MFSGHPSCDCRCLPAGVPTLKQINMLWLPPPLWLCSWCVHFGLALPCPCRHAAGVRHRACGSGLRQPVLQIRKSLCHGSIPLSKLCSIDSHRSCNGPRVPLTQSALIGHMLWHKHWPRCISEKGRRHRRPLVAVAMQHCQPLMARASQQHQGK